MDNVRFNLKIGGFKREIKQYFKLNYFAID